MKPALVCFSTWVCWVVEWNKEIITFDYSSDNFIGYPCFTDFRFLRFELESEKCDYKR